MTKKEKDIEKLLNNPTSLRFSEIEKILIDIGFEKIQARGSHIKLKYPTLEFDLIIPVHNNDCKDFYKKLASKIYNKITKSN